LKAVNTFGTFGSIESFQLLGVLLFESKDAFVTFGSIESFQLLGVLFIESKDACGTFLRKRDAYGTSLIR
jgi:hypothetical protein